MMEGDPDLREFIAHRVREGFETAHEIVENARNWAYEKYEREDLLEEIKHIASELFVAHLTDQTDWGQTTDCDRLDEAFAALNREGIVARQDFSCCNNCGFSEIWDEVEEAEKQQTIEGYVFYHLQSTEQVIKTGQLLMAFGCVNEDPEQFRRVGNKIVSELRRVGLNTSWGGTGNAPIRVDGILWRRRR